MRPLRLSTLLVLLVMAGATSWTLFDVLERRSGAPVPVPWTAPPAVLVLAGLVLLWAREVRRWVRGQRREPMNPLTAARVGVLSAAAGYVGALLAGWYAGQALVVLPALVGDRQTRFWLAILTALTSLLLAGAGLLGQRWCRRPPDDTDGPGDPGGPGEVPSPRR